MFKLLYAQKYSRLCTKFYQNRLGFVENKTKTFWSVFSVHTVYVIAFHCSQNELACEKSSLGQKMKNIMCKYANRFSFPLP